LLSDTNVTQGSVATYARSGGIFNNQLTAKITKESSSEKNFVNRLRFDRIMATSLWPHFLGHSVCTKSMLITSTQRNSPAYMYSCNGTKLLQKQFRKILNLKKKSKNREKLQRLRVTRYAINKFQLQWTETLLLMKPDSMKINKPSKKQDIGQETNCPHAV